MATVSGQVIFDLNRSSTLSPGDPGIANVPVILQNIETGARLVVLTDTYGNYAFINVPNGNYRIVEAFGTAGGVLTPGDFSTATLGPVPIATTPPISFVSNPPIGSTNLDSTTPNTVLITVTDNDITNQNILNGPVIYTPIQNILDPCVTVSDTNLITDADNGTFGFFLAGTPANTGPATEPYPGVTPDFTYVVPDPTTYTPIDGEYTVQNILNNAMSNQIGAWWRIADHTTGNETGRMMIVNGFNPGAVFFESTVNVTPNTNYLFSTWILNLFTTTGYPPAQLGVRILDQNGNNLYQAALGELIPVNTTAPEWREIGTVINSQNNTQLTVEFFSEGEAVIGNDYAIDDVSLKEVEIPTLTPVKSISTPTATIGDIATYTIQLTNTCRSPLTNVFFTDIIPNGLVFVPDSVTVNNNPFLGVDPNIGFALPDIAGGTSVEVTFNVRVENLPNPNPIDNSAVLNYSYTPVEGGIPNNFTVESNPVPLLVENEPEADITVVKGASSNPVQRGELLTYTMFIQNDGPDDAENVIVTDNIPDSIIEAEYSIDGGLTFNPWEGSLDLGTFVNGESRPILIRGIVSNTASGTIGNTATVTSTTRDPNPDNNTSTVEIVVVSEADLSVVKGANPPIASRGQEVVYSIRVRNDGPDDAENVIVTDDIPDSIINPKYLEGGFIPWTGSLNLGTLEAGESESITILGTVSDTAIGPVTNTATVTSTTRDPNLDNNTSTVDIYVSVNADMRIVKQANLYRVSRGEEVTYTVTVINDGPDDAENVIVTDDIPDSILDPEYSIDGSPFTPWTGDHLELGTFANDETRIILIRGIVSQAASGRIENTAIVSSTTPDSDPNDNESTASVTVEPEADVSVVKSASPSPVQRGELLTYTIVVTNDGPDDARAVYLNDSLPLSLLNPEFSLDNGATFRPLPPIYPISLSTIEAGGTRNVIVRGIVSDIASGTISNTAILTSITPDPNPDNNTSTVDVEIEEEQEADLSVTKQSSVPNATPGEEFIYTITISNNGPNAAQDVLLTDIIPTPVLNPEFSLDGVNFQPWTGRLNLDTVAPGQVITVIIRGTISPDATGVITNTAVINSSTPDPNFDNNTSTIEDSITPIDNEADLSATKQSSIPNATPGEEFIYTITISNNGPNIAQDVLLTDIIPTSVLNPEFSLDGVNFQPWTGHLNLDTVAPGQVITVIIRGTISPDATGVITNTAVINSSTPDPNFDNNTSTIENPITPIGTEADLSLIKQSNILNATPGEAFSYTITVSNAGPDAAQDVILTDTIPILLLNPEFSLDGVNFQPWTGRLNLDTVAPGQVVTIIIRGTVSPDATGVISNTAIINSSTPDPNFDNNNSTIENPITPIGTEADLKVIKRGNTPIVISGGPISYTITVSNTGPDTAQNVLLTDVIPSSVLNPVFSLDGGATFQPWEGNLNLGTIPPGQVITIIIRGTVSPDATGMITNTAVINSSTPDPNFDNNTSTIETIIKPAVIPSADISIVKLVNKRKAFVGDCITFKIIISNAGPLDAENVILIDNVTDFLKRAVVSTDNRVTYDPWKGLIILDNLPVGTSKVIFLSGIILPTSAHKIINTANVFSTTPDLNLKNNTSTVTVKIMKGCPDHCHHYDSTDNDCYCPDSYPSNYPYCESDD